MVDLDALQAAGIADAHRRRALIEYLDGLGFTADEMVEAERRGRLFGLSGDALWAGRPTFSLRSAAETLGVPLEQLSGVWAALEPKLVPANSVRQVLDYVSRGEVEAGFVYATDAAIMKDEVAVVATLTGPAPVSYPVAVVAQSRQKGLAHRFVQFLRAPPAREILAAYGFGSP